MKKEGEEVQCRPFRSRSPDASSRFLLSPASTTPTSIDTAISSPIHELSPIQHHRKKTSALSSNSRRHRCIIDEVAPTKGLWPSSSSSSSKKSCTLADHLGNDRLNDFMERKEHGDRSSSNTNQLLNRQRSCSSECSRFENEKEGSKENHRPSIGGSMRFTGKIKFLAKSLLFLLLLSLPGGCLWMRQLLIAVGGSLGEWRQSDRAEAMAMKSRRWRRLRAMAIEGGKLQVW